MAPTRGFSDQRPESVSGAARPAGGGSLFPADESAFRISVDSGRPLTVTMVRRVDGERCGLLA